MSYSLKQAVNTVLPPLVLFVFGVFALTRCYGIYNSMSADDLKDLPLEQAHILRLLIAFGAAAISVALPGFVEIGNKMLGRDDLKSQLSMNLKAGGALAIFVLVYLVEPL